MRVHRLRINLGVCAALSLLGCDEEPVAPTEVVQPAAPTLQIVDAVHSDGNAHFYFLPPLVADPSASGVFDASLQPAVEICAVADDACSETIMSFAADAVILDVDAEHYHVNWRTGDSELDPSATYRIRALVTGTELGWADVDVVSSGQELRNVATGEFIPLLDGRTLPIKFRIEEGAVFPIGTGGGVVRTPDGSVEMTVPEGALSTTVGIVVVPLASVPSDPDALQGAAYDFGPDGTTFNSPVEVSIRYDPAQVEAQGLVEELLRLHTIVDGVLVPLQGSLVDVDADIVSASLSGFSPYVIGQGSLTWTLDTIDVSNFAGANLRSLHGSAADNVFAVGANGRAYHYDGSSWSPPLATGTSGDLNAVWVLESGDAVAVGNRGIIRYTAGTWVAERTTQYGPADCRTRFIDAGDLNGDGRADIVCASGGGVTVLVADSVGGFSDGIAYGGAGVGSVGVALGDFDGDADLDVVHSVGNGVGVLTGNGDGTLGAQQVISLSSMVRPVAVGDVDGNGTPDIVAAGNTLWVLRGDGAGSFPTPDSIAGGLFTEDVALADVDGDTKLDIVLATSSSGQVLIYWGQGAGLFSEPDVILAAGDPRGITIADLDGDSDLDVAVSRRSGRDVVPLEHDGSRNFVPGPSLLTSDPSEVTEVESVSAADVNGDSQTDLLGVTWYYVSIHLGNGVAGFEPAMTVATDGWSQGVVAVDVDSDGDLDIVTPGNDVINVLRNQGTGVFEPSPVFYSVWGVPGDTLFAAGTAGTVLQNDGAGWTPKTASTTWDLKDLWASSGSDVYAVGDGPTINYFDGTEWTRVDPGVAANFTAVWGAGASDVFVAMGLQTPTGVIHFDGAGWSVQPVPEARIELFDIWGTSGNNVYLVGMFGDDRGGRIYRYDGASWGTELATPRGAIPVGINAVWGSGPTDVLMLDRLFALEIRGRP